MLGDAPFANPLPLLLPVPVRQTASGHLEPLPPPPPGWPIGEGRRMLTERWCGAGRVATDDGELCEVRTRVWVCGCETHTVRGRGR